MVMVALRDRTVMKTEQEHKVRIYNERKINLMCGGESKERMDGCSL